MDDQMIKEMEAAYASVPPEKGSTREERIKDIDRKEKEREEAVSRAVQKYFPEKMKAEEAYKLLRHLKERGFKVSEWRHEGARNWPDDEFKPYLDEPTRRHLQKFYPKGTSEFVAEKIYGVNIMILATKHVVIRFRVVDGSGVISDVKGDIGASGV